MRLHLKLAISELVATIASVTSSPHGIKVAFPTHAGHILDRLATALLEDKASQSLFDRRILGRQTCHRHSFLEKALI